MKTKIVLCFFVLIHSSSAIAESYDYLGEYDEQQSYPSYDDSRRRMGYGIGYDSCPNLDQEYCQTETERQKAKRQHMRNRLKKERLQYEQAESYHEHYQRESLEESKRSEILTTNQAINTLGNIANQVRLIQELFK